MDLVAGAFGYNGTSETQTIFDMFNGALGAEELFTVDDANLPKAYLNYLFFDKNLVFNNEFGYSLVSASALNEWEKLALDKIIDEPGFLYIYVANESMADVNVYFDDMEIRINESPLAQSADYYPFGLEIADRSFNRESYRFGYQGQFAEKDEETGWNSFELRNYYAVIGRWLSVDPESQYFNPYNGNGNNPIINVDPSGGLNPIHGSDGKFRGYDSEGVGGEIIVYDGNFYAGMDQQLTVNLNTNCL